MVVSRFRVTSLLGVNESWQKEKKRKKEKTGRKNKERMVRYNIKLKIESIIEQIKRE